jgi:hypothetical protein
MVRKENRKSKPVLIVQTDAPVLVEGARYHSILGGIAKDYQLSQDPSIKDNVKMGELIFLIAGYSQSVQWEDKSISRQQFFEEWINLDSSIIPNFQLELRPEPTNLYDSNAIQVIFKTSNKDWSYYNGFSVGYVPKRIAYYIKQNLSLIKKIDIADIVQMQNEDLAFHIRITYNNEYLDESEVRFNKRFSRII